MDEQIKPAGVVPKAASTPLAIWWRAIRPKSFTATFTPVAIGIGCAALDSVFAPLWALLTLVAALLLQAGTNLLNDYFDHRNQVDSSASLSPSGVIQQGLLTPRAVLIGGGGCFGLAALLGIALALHGGPLIWLLGVIGVLIGVLYTAGPAPLAYIGLGEIAVFIAMGPGMVLGAYSVQTQGWSWTPLLAGTPIGLLVAAIMHANNLRDIETDRTQNKRTLAARFGRRFAQREYALLVLGAYSVLVPLLALDLRLGLSALPVLLTLPQAWRLVREAFATDDPVRLNRVLRGTAVLHGRWGWLWLLGLLSAVIVSRYSA
ncbi:MAG TPA: 1,4-dihydroxy-2-naphthoate octaprenyltransferase [Herpetosiphonaceae bacterium]